MIFLTGDTHGDFTRFSNHGFPPQKFLSKSDYVIVCGDFGIWDNSKSENCWLDWLDGKSFTTLFVDGNHSNFDLLNRHDVQIWNGGKVHKIRDSVIHLMRGQVFDIDGHTVFTMGGGSSHDIQAGILEPDDPDFAAKRKRLDRQMALYRINHVSWWKEELPDDMEYAEALKNLAAHDFKVDYIVTHCCPSSIADILGGGLYQPDRLTDFFESLKNRCQFRYWFFGHYHDEGIVMQKYILLYRNFLSVEDLG